MNTGSLRLGLCLSMWAQTVPTPSSAFQREERAPGIEVAVSNNLEDDGRLVSYELAIVNRQNAPLDASWRLYFNLGFHVVAGSASSWVELTHINGDFYRLSPGTTYEPMSVRERRTFRFQARGSVVNRSLGPRGFYWTRVDDGRESAPERIDDVVWAPFERPEQTSRNARDRVEAPTPESRYRENASLSLLEAAEVPPIIPTPRTIRRGSGDYALEGNVSIGHASGLEAEAAYLSEALLALVGEAPVTAVSIDDGAHAIRLSLDIDADPERAEGYRLVVDPARGIDVVGADRAGVFYGVQSLLALLRPDRTLPAVSIDDAPRFPYRGQHLDVARHFQPVGTVLRLIDVMARYKLNNLHLHLTDDEGWRIAIDGLSGLTSIGSRRAHTLDGRDRLLPSLGSGPDDTTTGSGFYTRQDYIDILEYATARHVEVIPEIDLPGHARAAIVAMRRGPYRLDDPDDASEYRSIQGWDDNVVDVCSELTYRFLETVLDDLVGMYAEAKAPFRFFHIGGDEVPTGVWERSPSCEALLESGTGPRGLGELVDYFLDRAHAIVEARGLRLSGWEEIALTRDSHDLDAPKVPNPRGAERGYRVNAWLSVPGRGNEATAYRLANAGYEVILSNASHLYFDMAYEKGADEPGMYWAGFVDTRRVWSFSPLSLETSSTTDLMGQPLPPDYAADWPKLTARKNIRGIQGQLWSETLSSPDLMEHAALPKLLALAERAWSSEDEDRSDVAWNRFANALGQRELPRLDALGVAYRLPPPGAIVEDGRLLANVAFPGLAIRFTRDGTDPTASSERYVEPVLVRVGAPVRLRTVDTIGRGSRVVELRP